MIGSTYAGTLRQAIFDANVTSPGPDTILLDSSLDGQTITLGEDEFGNDLNFSFFQGQIDITESLTIDAQGQHITIDASGHQDTPGIIDGDGFIDQLDLDLAFAQYGLNIDLVA